jgi:hypothetical protein
MVHTTMTTQTKMSGKATIKDQARIGPGFGPNSH